MLARNEVRRGENRGTFTGPGCQGMKGGREGMADTWLT